MTQSANFEAIKQRTLYPIILKMDFHISCKGYIAIWSTTVARPKRKHMSN
jgi:hypothetical protein